MIIRTTEGINSCGGKRAGKVILRGVKLIYQGCILSSFDVDCTAHV
jgi:hypothetical protein